LRALIFLLGALIVAAVAHVLWLSEDHPSIRFTLFQKDAGDLLAALVADAELPITQANAVYRLEEDGTQPDTAMQTFVIATTADQVRAGFLHACGRAGLGKPAAMTLRSDPDALCEGPWKGGNASVSVQIRCTRSCQASVAVYHLWF
jgi:hypothetical protein